MTDSRVAKRYARALFNIALQQDILQSVEDDLTGVCAVIAHSKDLKHFLGSPNRTREDKMKLLEGIFSDRVTALTMHTVRLLLKRRREVMLELVKLEYLKLRRDHDMVTHALVTSASPLDQPHRDRIVAKIEAATKKRVEAEFVLDPKLIGGVKVMYDNFVLDGTARGYLNRMKNHILYDVLKQA